MSAGATALRIERDFVVRQLAAARVIFKNPIALHYSIDGVAAAGEHNDFFVAVDPSQGYAYIGPPQVFLYPCVFAYKPFYAPNSSRTGLRARHAQGY